MASADPPIREHVFGATGPVLSMSGAWRGGMNTSARAADAILPLIPKTTDKLVFEGGRRHLQARPSGHQRAEGIRSYPEQRSGEGRPEGKSCIVVKSSGAMYKLKEKRHDTIPRRYLERHEAGALLMDVKHRLDQSTLARHRGEPAAPMDLVGDDGRPMYELDRAMGMHTRYGYDGRLGMHGAAGGKANVISCTDYTPGFMQSYSMAGAVPWATQMKRELRTNRAELEGEALQQSTRDGVKWTDRVVTERLAEQLDDVSALDAWCPPGQQPDVDSDEEGAAPPPAEGEAEEEAK